MVLSFGIMQQFSFPYSPSDVIRSLLVLCSNSLLIEYRSLLIERRTLSQDSFDNIQGSFHEVLFMKYDLVALDFLDSQRDGMACSWVHPHKCQNSHTMRRL